MRFLLFIVLSILCSELLSQDCVQFEFSDESAQIGDTICFDLTVSNADSITLFFFATCHDISSLEYVYVQDLQNIEGFRETDIFFTQGVIRVLYSHPRLEYVNIDDTIPLLSICFRLKETTQRVLTIRECSDQLAGDSEFLDNNNNSFPVCSNIGYLRRELNCPAEAPTLRRP